MAETTTTVAELESKSEDIHELIDSVLKEKGTFVSLFSFNSQCVSDEHIENVSQLKVAVERCPAVWIDVVGLKDKEIIKDILDLLKVDVSVLDLILDCKNKAFYKSFGNSIFLTVQVLHKNRSIETSNLSILQVGNTVVTFREGLCESVCNLRADVRQQHSALNEKGRLYVLQRLVETSVDSFQFILDAMSVELEDLEEKVISKPENKIMKGVHSIRKELLILKRIIIPLKGEMRQFARDSHFISSEAEKTVSQELLQYTSNMMDTVEYFISVTSDVMALHMSSVSNRMNEVMTVLAIVAAIFLPPSLIASIYGMNFYNHTSPWNMPELNWDHGYPFALALMICISVSFVAYFWKKGWFDVFVK